MTNMRLYVQVQPRQPGKCWQKVTGDLTPSALWRCKDHDVRSCKAGSAAGMVLKPCCPSMTQESMSIQRCMLLACCRQPGLLLLGASCRTLWSTCSSTRCVNNGSGSREMMPDWQYASAAALRAGLTTQTCRLVI
jgi:hypothetical protein